MIRQRKDVVEWRQKRRRTCHEATVLLNTLPDNSVTQNDFREDCPQENTDSSENSLSDIEQIDEKVDSSNNDAECTTNEISVAADEDNLSDIQNREDVNSENSFKDHGRSTEGEDISDSDIDSFALGTKNLGDDLSSWATQHNITQSALTDLLKVITKNTAYNLPKSAKTLLKTPRCNPTVVEIGNGTFNHFGFLSGLKEKLKRGLLAVPNSGTSGDTVVNFSVNIDGIPL